MISPTGEKKERTLNQTKKNKLKKTEATKPDKVLAKKKLWDTDTRTAEFQPPEKTKRI
jgi:hypothetical protein